jgi:ferric-dicitrate binding protein FerR (iron transport regulator)
LFFFISARGGAAAPPPVLVPVGWRSLRSAETGALNGAAHVDSPATTRLTVAAVDGTGASIEMVDGSRAAAGGDRIAAGASVQVAGAGHVVLALDTGTRLRVGASSRVRLTSLGATQRFDLDRGTLEAEVAKVPLGGRFVIATGDAEVEVKGTRFEVAVVPTPSACAPFVRTQVMVQEGVVAVRFAGGEVRLAAGSVWPVCAPPAPGVHSSHDRARESRSPAPRPAIAAAVAPKPADPSTLAEQNDLFAAALSARRRGDLAEAIHFFDRLITHYPNGQLIDSARSERQRLIDAGGEKAPAQ